MRRIFYLLPILAVLSCGQKHKQVAQTPQSTKQTEPEQRSDIKFTDQQLETFLDSIGQLPTQPLVDRNTRWADSVFKAQTKPMNHVVNAADFEILKRAALDSVIKASDVKRIFGEMTVDSTCTAKGIFDSVTKGSIFIKYFPFNMDRRKFDEFAIKVGDQRHCHGSELYFFRKNRIIGKQDGYGRYDDDVNYFIGEDGEAFVYKVADFTDGSGCWWNNYFFYKYDGDKLIPVLNELENGNVQGSANNRVLWLATTVEKTRPLTIKMVYYDAFTNSVLDSPYVFGPNIINDSTLVRYKWDAKTKTLQGQYDHSKISRAQVVAHYLDEDCDLLFINSYYKIIKASLADKKLRKLTLGYLNAVKNHEIYNRLRAKR